MQVTIDLPPDLEQDLVRQAAESNISLQILILRALRQLSRDTMLPLSEWPDTVLLHEGVAEFPAFEAYREELTPPPDTELF
ncbi:MAG: hypothetical protein AAGF24_14600 [Cyanobacteria bacterium P01_H01_bin.121]